MFGIETKVMGGDGRPVPQGEPGELWVRGNIVAASYYGGIASEAFQDGWFRTGDVVRVDGAGRLSVVDRIRDLVKSGGEWISSLELESQASAHPSVMEAAVIGLPHPRWAERPLLLVRLQRGHSLDVAALREHLVATCPRWWLPDAILDHGPIPAPRRGRSTSAHCAKPTTAGISTRMACAVRTGRSSPRDAGQGLMTTC